MHGSGKSNSNADVLSRNPVPSDAQPPKAEPADENSQASDNIPQKEVMINSYNTKSVNNKEMIQT